jgi:drug/metabolite transporter (DMT)-like permease
LALVLLLLLAGIVLSFPSVQTKIAQHFTEKINKQYGTNIINSSITIDWRGILFGLLAAASFTTTMFTANSVATNISSAQRSLYMLLGGAVIVFIFGFFTQTTAFNFDIFMKWGVLLALFGTIIPPMLMNAGFPLTGIGLGSIVSALELPVSVLMAFFILNEQVVVLQWFGIILIIGAIVLMNMNFNKLQQK